MRVWAPVAAISSLIRRWTVRMLTPRRLATALSLTPATSSDSSSRSSSDAGSAGESRSGEAAAQ